MCQTKKKGGKRCARHMNGSVASVRTCVILTGVEESFVGKVFSSLKQEGKDLPSPEKEDVVSYAKAKQFEAKFDPNIPNTKRKSLIQRWIRAEEDTPDGGTMHAWRNLVPATITRYNVKSVAAAGILASSLLLAGCGPANDNTATPPPSPTESSVIATPSPTHTVLEGQNPSFPEAPFKVPAQFEANGTASNSKGEYLKFKLKDSELQKLDKSVLTDEAKSTFKEKDLEDINKIQQKFISEYMVDNVAGADEANKPAYIKELKESGHLDQSTYKWIDNPDMNLSVMPNIEDDNGDQLDVEFYKNAPRVVDYNLKLTGVDVAANNDKVALMNNDIDYTFVAKDKKTGKSVFRNVKGFVSVALFTSGPNKGKVFDYYVDLGVYEAE